MIISNIREILKHLPLIHVLIFREMKTRYRGTVLGFLWTLLNPLLMMATYSLVFSNIAKFGIKGYPVFLLCGLLPWICFSSSLLAGCNSIADRGLLIKSIYFPIQILPTTTVAFNFVHLLLSVPCLLVFMSLYQIPIGWNVVMLLPVGLLQLALTEGVVLILASLAVTFRDVVYMLSNFIPVWLFLTPVLYPVSRMPEPLRAFLFLNPMAPIIVAYQDILFYRRQPDWGQLGMSALIIALILALGFFVFERCRWTFAEDL